MVSSKASLPKDTNKNRSGILNAFRTIIVLIVISCIYSVFRGENGVQPAAQVVVLISALVFLIWYAYKFWFRKVSSNLMGDTNSDEVEKAVELEGDPTISATLPKR